MATEKKDKEVIENKIALNSYVLIRDYPTDGGIKKAKTKIEASELGAKVLKAQGYIN